FADHLFRRKKSNLDGPDEWNSYWGHLHEEPIVFLKRNFGGGNATSWTVFSWSSKLYIEFMTSRMNPADYQEVLKDQMLPLLRCNATTDTFFSKKSLPSIFTGMTARSPDLNPMEHLWGILACRLYAQNKQ
ncbi:hypothetical protein OESDEN_17221, partial [Oesophagostomum dentatum]